MTMRLKVGDRVKFLNDTGAGKLTRIVDKNTGMVQIDEGFEVPVLLKELVPESGMNPYEQQEEQDVEHTGDSPPEQFGGSAPTRSEPEMEDEELVLAFLPENNTSDFRSYLINSTSYRIFYVISRDQAGEQIRYHSGELEEGTKVFMGNYHPRDHADHAVFRIQSIFHKEGFFKQVQPVDALISIRGSNFLDPGEPVENDYFNEKALVFTVYDFRKKYSASLEVDPEEIRKALYTKGDQKDPKRSSPGKKQKAIEEVDLHIESLVEDSSGLSNGEILEIQMSRFRTVMDTLLRHKPGRAVLIHGVGNGKLKLELRKTLDREYRTARYQDASFKEYGYGATMVIV